MEQDVLPASSAPHHVSSGSSEPAISPLASKPDVSLTSDSNVSFERTQGPVAVLCDSINKYLTLKQDVDLTIRPMAVDNIQGCKSSDIPIIIHTGTNSLDKESAKRIKLRFQRFESNIKAKNFKTISISGIVYRGGELTGSKI